LLLKHSLFQSIILAKNKEAALATSLPKPARAITRTGSWALRTTADLPPRQRKSKDNAKALKI